MGLDTTVTFSIMGTQPIFEHLSMAVDGGNLTQKIRYKDHSIFFWIPWDTPQLCEYGATRITNHKLYS